MFKFSLPSLSIKSSGVVRNMLLVGGAVSTVSFFTAFGTARATSFKDLKYTPPGKYTGPINSVSALEDYARSQKCNFLFYDPPKGGSSVTVKEARDYLSPEDKKEKEQKILDEAEKLKAHCTENSFVYAKVE